MHTSSFQEILANSYKIWSALISVCKTFQKTFVTLSRFYGGGVFFVWVVGRLGESIKNKNLRQKSFSQKM